MKTKLGIMLIGAAAIGVACAEVDTSRQEIFGPDQPARIDVQARFERALANPQSMGNRHNAGLDQILRAMREARKANGGKRLTVAQACEIVTRTAMSNLNANEAAVFAKNPSVVNSKGCTNASVAQYASVRLRSAMDSIAAVRHQYS